MTLIAAIFSFTSCDNAFLDDAEPKGKVSDTEVFSNAGSIQMLVNGLYFDFGYLFGGGYGNCITHRTLQWLSDESDYTFVPTYAFRYYSKASYEPGDPTGYIDDLWNGGYKTIYQANQLINGLPTATADITEDERNNYLGQAYLLRAQSYYVLSQLFGDVPLELTNDVTVNATLKRTEKAKVLEQVLNDLTTAVSKLSATPPTDANFYTSKYQAEAYLSYVYLALGKWTEAEAAATDVITNGGFSLVTDLSKIFSKGSKEAILAIGNTEKSLEGAGSYGIFIYMGNLYSMFPTDSLVRAYGTDPRLNTWFPTGTVSGKTTRIPKKYKYTFTQAYIGAAAADPQNDIYLRLAEVYLIRAEARAQQGTAASIASAVADINVIRNRAGATPIPATTTYTKAQTMKFVETERVLELSFEGKRWLDLVRWGTADAVYQKLKSNYKTDWASYKTLLPIPATQLNANPNLKPQNTGYAQ
jgi:hypothetical protein